MPTKLSAALIAFNEEDKIEKCLRALSFVDEIIVVDSGSTDKTRSIAESCGARVSARAFDNFSYQKNEAIRQTTGDWILLVDADEIIPPALASEIRSVVESNPAENGFWIKRKNFIFGRALNHGANANDWQLRLIRKGRGTFSGTIHERVTLEGASAKLKSIMEHYTTQTLEDYFRRLFLYTSLEAGRMHAEGKKPTWFDVALKPALHFVYFYFFRLGFLDGFEGLQYAVLSSYYLSIKSMKALELFRNSARARSKKSEVCVHG